MEPLAVDLQQAANLVGVSVFTLRRRIKDGRLRAIRIGTRLLVPTEELRRLVSVVENGQAGTPQQREGKVIHEHL